MHVPSGHTDVDSIVFFPKSNVVHMGDYYLRIGFPVIELGGGASVSGLIAGLEEVIFDLPADVKVIPGHGESCSVDDIRTYLKMLKETLAVVETGVKKGKSLEELKQEKVLEPWKEWSGVISAESYHTIRLDVLDWNESAIKFYKSLGARYLQRWRNVVIGAEALGRLGRR